MEPADVEALLARLDGKRDEVIALTQDLVRVPTGHLDGPVAARAGRCFAVGVARRAAVAGGQLSRAFSIPTGATARSRRRPATRWSGRPGRRLRAVPGRARGGAEPVGPG
jgi:hypothetical protein